MADSDSDLAGAVQEVTERAQRIVRDEIELAKAEVTEKATKLAKGVAVGAAAGVFLLGALIYFLHSLSWLFYRLFFNDGPGVWLGYLITTGLLVLFGAIAGFVAYRFVKGGSPPKPEMAIEEAQRVKATLDAARTSDRQLAEGSSSATRP